jgi:uncharacterized DUF497 family protein
MSDFDPAKEAINLSKHGISLARWIDIDMKITFVDSRYDYGESDTAVMDTSTVSLTVWCSPTVMDGCGQSAFDAHTIRK